MNVNNNKETNYKDTRWKDKVREKIRADNPRTVKRWKVPVRDIQEIKSADEHKIDQRVVR